MAMIRPRKYCQFYLVLLLALLESYASFSQNQKTYTIRGSVTDANTADPVPFASVSLKGTAVGTNTDKNGRFIIQTGTTAETIEFSFIGYQTESRRLGGFKDQVFDISLKLSVIALDEVTVKPQRANYRNRGNPAVELIQKVIDNKNRNRRESFDYLQCSEYEKILFAVSNLKDKVINGRMFEKFRFAFDNIDTTKRIGRNVLPVFIKESISDHYYRKESETTRDIVRAEKVTNLNEYFDNKGVSEYFQYLYQDINIYDNEILFLTNKFISPIAGTAPAFYRYYILDTLDVGELKCIKLFFEPRNKEDFLFHGDLYILMDSTYAVRKIDMGINKDINLDWIKEISISQDFDKSGNSWLLSREDILIDFGILKNTLGLYGQRTVKYQDYRTNEFISNEIFTGNVKNEIPETVTVSPEYWDTHRFIPLSKSEEGSYRSIDSLKKMNEFRNRMKLVTLVTTGFYELGKIEIGPTESFFSYNSVEGPRVRFGGRTSTLFSKKYTFETYAAYGFKDQLLKYNAAFTWSFTPRSIYEFPVKSLKVGLLNDTRFPGQELLFTQPDNVFLSFKRGPDDKLLINRTLRAEFLDEFQNHFSFLAGYSFSRQSPLGTIHFIPFNYPAADGELGHINVSELYLNLRFAPDESFYQGRMYRFPFPGRKPVVQLKTAIGTASLHDGLNYARLQFSISQRFYTSVIGYTDISVEAGQIFGKLPFQLLFIHTANQTYSYQRNSYNLMNFMEFVSDRYASLNIDHSFNGFFLNKVPLISKLKLREIVTLKVIAGDLSPRNNPAYNPDLFRFPEDGTGKLLTYGLNGKPYIEAGVGVSNIFRIFRVDFVKRFTYLDNPYVSETGFLFQFKFDL